MEYDNGNMPALVERIIAYLEDYIDDEDERQEMAVRLAEHCIDDYEELLEIYEEDDEDLEFDLTELIESGIEELDREDRETFTGSGPGLFGSLVDLIFGTEEAEKKKNTDAKEERFRTAHGNEEDFLEMYGDDFDSDEEAEDAFYEEMEDEEF